MTAPERPPARTAVGHWRRWGLVVAYMAGLLALSSIPNPPDVPGAPSDKLVHVALYAGLGAVSLRAIAAGRWARVTIGAAVAAAGLAAAYGCGDEAYQALVDGRQSDLADVAADAIGGAASAFGLWAWGILTKKE